MHIQTKAMELLSLSLKLFSFKRIAFKECKGIKILLECRLGSYLSIRRELSSKCLDHRATLVANRNHDSPQHWSFFSVNHRFVLYLDFKYRNCCLESSEKVHQWYLIV